MTRTEFAQARLYLDLLIEQASKVVDANPTHAATDYLQKLLDESDMLDINFLEHEPANVPVMLAA